LQQPFTIAVSGLGGDGSVLWQGGASQDGQDEEAEAEEKDRAREVAAA
jgi:hypothetical protein